MTDVKVEDHLFPVRDLVIVENAKEDITSSGIHIPEMSQKRNLGVRVVAVGEHVKSVKAGDLIIPTEGPMSMFKLFGRELVAMNEFQVLARISEEAMSIDATYNKFEDLTNI